VQICHKQQTGEHLGYAVSYFETPAAAQLAIDMLHNFKVHGRNIVVAPYKKRSKDPAARHTFALQCSQYAADDALSVVMNLSRNVQWMYDFFMPLPNYGKVYRHLQNKTCSYYCYLR
jgi:RNA recognition motif-containing protein